jgi:hypothetical protein
LQQSGSWIALSIVAAAALLLVTDAQLMSYAQVPAVPAVPTYRDCTPGITLDPDANLKLENARQRAIKFIDAARTVLANAPAPGSTYETALNRHFVAPTAADRATINDHYRDIRATLRVQNYICNTPVICGTNAQASWGGIVHHWNDDLIHICRSFFDPHLDITCRAITLIHEGAHDERIDAVLGVAGGGGVGIHAPYRGESQDLDGAGPAPPLPIVYPLGNTAPHPTETTANRMDNPDAYGFFAAHIWRSTDTARAC